MIPSPVRCLSLFVCLSAAVGAFAESPTERAAALLDRGEFLAAERLIESLALAKKPDPVAVWELSRVRTGQQLTEEGIKLAEKAIKLDPTQARFHAQLGSAILAHMGAVGRLDQGSLGNRMRKAFEKALALEPDNVTALLGLCRYYWSPTDRSPAEVAKAVELAERAAKFDPFKAEIELGGIATRKGQFQDALRHLEAATALKPDDADAQLNCGHLLLRLGRRQEARERFELALKLAPKSELARRSLEMLDTPVLPPPKKP